MCEARVKRCGGGFDLLDANTFTKLNFSLKVNGGNGSNDSRSIFLFFFCY